MRIPAWVSWTGLVEHGLIGAAITGLCAWAHAAGWLAVVLALALGLWHEWMDGDFRTEAGAPWNGVVDVLAFLPGPLIGWALAG